jgi:hypothetical protein
MFGRALHGASSLALFAFCAMLAACGAVPSDRSGFITASGQPSNVGDAGIAARPITIRELTIGTWLPLPANLPSGSANVPRMRADLRSYSTSTIRRSRTGRLSSWMILDGQSLVHATLTRAGRVAGRPWDQLARESRNRTNLASVPECSLRQRCSVLYYWPAGKSARSNRA